MANLATFTTKKGCLFFPLHAFGDGRKTQLAGEPYDGATDGLVVGIAADVTHERTVDFQLMQWQPF